MTLRELCEKIDLAQDLTKTVLAFEKSFDFTAVMPFLEAYKDYQKACSSDGRLASFLAPDKQGIKMLAVQLYGACQSAKLYREKGIPQDIYIATMKCFSRFCNESKQINGVSSFDRSFWVGRQIGGHLFRIGELEYELKSLESPAFIGMHIPSDAFLTKDNIERSLKEAKAFLVQFFPAFAEAEFRCGTWLFAPELKAMLPENSRILTFQSFFDFTDTPNRYTNLNRWVFQCPDDTPVAKLPEKTCLQRQLKAYFSLGKTLGGRVGVVKPEFL